jgi:hypothetical protein
MLMQANDFKSFVEQQSQVATKKTSSMSDTRFIKFQRDNTYRFRLLATSPDSGSRTGPFIELYNHGSKNADGYYRSTVCHTTTLGNKGFDKCPVCKNNTKLWASHEKGNTADKALYDLFKRKFHGYALVYVVNDPTTPENNGQVRVMHYTKGCKDYFAQEVFGTVGDYDAIGFDAFDTANGFDFYVTVGEKSGYNHYTYRFANRPSAVPTPLEELGKMIAEIDFDGGTLIKNTPTDAETEKFYREVVLGNSEDGNSVDAPVRQPAPKAQASTLAEQVQIPTTKAVEIPAVDSGADSLSESPQDVDDLLARLQINDKM